MVKEILKSILEVKIMRQNQSGSNNAVKTGTVITHLLADDGKIPNNPTLPLLVYQGALDLPENDPAATIEAVFASNSWGGSWRNGVYKYHHYHSTAHEVLGVYSGTAQVQFGGEKGVILTVKRGDVVVIPAGVGHKNVGQSHDFRVVGAYPHAQHADLNGEDSNVRPQADENIAHVPLPELDPVYGAESPLIEHWGKS
jgi:uncharacterized protein YjlB